MQDDKIKMMAPPKRKATSTATCVQRELPCYASWKPISTAPKNRCILIRVNNYQPDFVKWQEMRPERVVNGNKYLSIPAGWFRVHGSRSHILTPTEWLDIPA